MNSIREYLLGLAKEQFALDRNPVVAMDCIAAKSRGQLLERIAAEVEGVSEEAALDRLKAFRARYNGVTDEIGASVIGWVFAVSDSKWFDGIVDRVSHENVGCIEVSSTGYDYKTGKLLHLPAYSRKLGINHHVAYIARGKDETASAWLRRRAEWFSAYHPAVKVVHSRKRYLAGRAEQEIDLGTVASFVEVEHLVEADLASVRAIRTDDGALFELVETFWKPNASGAIGTVRQSEGEPRQPGLLKMQHYALELVA
jgi:hypothetical protein